MIDLKTDDQVAIVQMTGGVTNPLNPACVSVFAETVQQVKSDPDIHALVLRSANNKFFSIGLDIPQLIDLSEEDFRQFYKLFNQVCMELYTMPKPTVAAVTGHAIAGGCILALCCDYRLIARGRKLMGLNEIKLGVPVPYLAHLVLESLVGIRQAREIMDTGDFYAAQESLKMGMVDQVVPLSHVVPKSIERARRLGSMHQEAFRMIKRNRTEKVETRVRSHWEEKQQFFIKCWFSEEAQAQLKEALKTF